MIDLQLSSGLPIKFDELGEQLEFGNGVAYDTVNRVPLQHLLPGLLNKSLKYPKYVYTEHKNVRSTEHESEFRKSGLNFDIVMIPAGLMGVEFIRSHIFQSECSPDGEVSVNEIVEVASGELTVLLQKNKPAESELEFEKKVSQGLVVKLKKGEKFCVPSGYFYTFINTKGKPVVFSRLFKRDCVCDYSAMKREQGLAYFAIKKNAKQEIVLNPRYRDIPKIEIRKAPETTLVENQPKLGRDPLYVQAMSLGSALSWLG